MKELILSIIIVAFMLPCIISIVQTTLDPSPENIGETTEKIAMQTIPWWVGVLEWLANLPSSIAGFMIIGFIFFLRWLG